VQEEDMVLVDLVRGAETGVVPALGNGKPDSRSCCQIPAKVATDLSKDGRGSERGSKDGSTIPVIDLMEGAIERLRKRQESQVAREARKKENQDDKQARQDKELKRNFNSRERKLNVLVSTKSYS
jgi:hypothetical protein